MSCDSASKLIPLYYYGELTPEEEDRLDQHLHECPACAAAMERQRALAAALDRRQLDVPPLLLDDCRADLMAAIAGGAARAERPTKGPWALFLEAVGVTFAGFGRVRQPIGALALVVLGVLLGRLSGTIPGLSPASNLPSENVISSVRSVKAESNGTVQVSFDETRRREITGRLDDPNIQRFILAGSRGDNPAVRVESVGLLRNQTGSPEAVDALLNSIVGDPVDSVRMEAMEALKPLAGDSRVTKALSQVLLTDANPRVRMQAIDLMAMHRDDSVVGVFQSLMQREDNSGVRLKASKVLKDWNASIGTF